MDFEKSNSEDLFTKKYKLNASCIIPAAGLSSRMGCWKGELLTREGRTFLENAVLTARDACSRVIVVGGFQFSEVTEILKDFTDIFILQNEEYEKGMLRSIQKGLELVENDFYIFPMDMPLIRTEIFFRISEISVPGKINRPEYKGVPGHPVLFPEAWRDIILEMEGESLGKGLKPGEQNMIPWEEASVISDLDSLTEYQNYMSFHSI